MKPVKRIALAAIAMATAALAIQAAADDDGDEYYEHRRPAWGAHARPGVAPVDNPQYREECGACHMAYPPGLLPALSWERIMSSLDDHFGENAELDEATRRSILNYLLNYAAGRSDYRLSNRLVRSLGYVPTRITELPYFKREHYEIPPRLVLGNPKVRSFSNCNACHRYAERGSFNEHEIYIPGYGRYEDD